ncbi:hypothetical protein DFH08DRAFT_811323 [Mycena albidolilacea]|uniref:Uncharacterized protein n=1 Tax=Mycena albidolilacea TaxID=1033008 RepID=A0AAD6ZXT6_9AGAR|nr:hypothetical protein DFH08DRAFT_811323 [Mycena albidolilacea]
MHSLGAEVAVTKEDGPEGKVVVVVVVIQQCKVIYVEYQSKIDWRSARDILRCNPRFCDTPRFNMHLPWSPLDKGYVPEGRHPQVRDLQSVIHEVVHRPNERQRMTDSRNLNETEAVNKIRPHAGSRPLPHRVLLEQAVVGSRTPDKLPGQGGGFDRSSTHPLDPALLPDSLHSSILEGKP